MAPRRRALRVETIDLSSQRNYNRGADYPGKEVPSMCAQPEPTVTGDANTELPSALLRDGMMDRGAPPARPSTGKKLVFALLITSFLLVLAEVLCRVLGVGGEVQVAHYISQWHETPDGRTFWVVRGAGYNADGMRDREHPVPRPPDTYRIVCLGDSVTAGHGVKRSENYPSVFERYLRQIGLAAEVMNVAVSGWSTLQEATAYRHIARRYQPDHVFLGFCLNDVAEMRNNLTRPPSAISRFLAHHSAMVRWAVGARRRQISNVRQLFAEPDSPAVRDGWRGVFEELTALKDWIRADGCELSVVIFPFRFQLEDSPPEPVAQRTLVEFCRRHAIPCLDLLPALRRLGTDAFIDESHLSFEGARAVAEELVRWGRSGCSMCGYDLADVTAGACPRCGEPIKR